MLEAALILVAYGLGAIPFGVLIARSRGIDLFKVGSGNVGATNVKRALGKGPALLVFALDVLKGAAPAVGARLLTGSPEWALAAGLAAIAGHCLSPFLRFRGGKGVATGLGMLSGAAPLVAVSALGLFLASMAVWRYVSLSSIVAAASLLPLGLLYGDSPVMLASYGVLGVFVIWRHRANIARLRNGTESKFEWKREDDSGPDAEKNQELDGSGSNQKEMTARSDPATPSGAPFGADGRTRA